MKLWNLNISNVREKNNKIEIRRPDSLARLIKSYLDESVILSDSEKIQFDRIVEADKLLKDFKVVCNERRAELLSKQFKISLRQARTDLKTAAEFFNSVEPIDKKTGARIIISQIDMLISELTSPLMEDDQLVNEKTRSFFTREYVKEITALLKLKKETYADLFTDFEIDPSLIKNNTVIFNMGAGAKDLLAGEAPVSRAEIKRLLRDYSLSKKQADAIIQDIDFIEEIEEDA